MNELSDSDKQELKATFDIFDVKQYGFVEIGRVSTLIRAAGETPTETKMNEIIKTANENRGQFTLDNLLQVVSQLRNDKDNRRPSVNDVEAAFRVFDPTGKGYIMKDELKKVLTTFGDKLSPKEAEDLLNEADIDEQGRIDYIRFSSKLIS